MSRFSLALVLASASASALVPARPAAPRVVEKKSLDHALALRGGGVVSKANFIKAMSGANALFGLQFFLIPKMFIEMNFDNFDTSEEILFVSRICGISLLGGGAAFLLGDAEKLYRPAMAMLALIAAFGPLKAEMTFDCRMEHKLPCILIPGLLLLGALAY